MDVLSREPALAVAVNGVLLRAARRLRARLSAGEAGALVVYGRREGLSLRVHLRPPNTAMIEQVRAADAPIEGALVV